MRRLSKDNTVNINGALIPLHLIKSMTVSDRECTVTLSLDSDSDSDSPLSDGFSQAEVGTYYTVDGRCCGISGLPLYGNIVVKLRQGEYLLPESAELPQELADMVHKAHWDRGDYDLNSDPAHYEVQEMTMEGFKCGFSDSDIPMGANVVYIGGKGYVLPQSVRRMPQSLFDTLLSRGYEPTEEAQKYHRLY